MIGIECDIKKNVFAFISTAISPFFLSFFFLPQERSQTETIIFNVMAKCSLAAGALAHHLIKNTIISIRSSASGEIDSDVAELGGVPQRTVDSYIHPGLFSSGTIDRYASVNSVVCR